MSLWDVVLDAQFMADPFPSYARFRAMAPVRPVLTPDGLRVWLVTRYADVRAALADPRLSKDLTGLDRMYRRHTQPGRVVRQVANAVGKHMLASDPPEHTRLRTLVGRAFTGRRIDQLRPTTERLSTGLLDRLAGRAEVELIADYAFPLAIGVICELLGLPANEQEQFQLWTQEYNSSGSAEVVNAAAGKLAGYLVDLLRRKRRAPGDDLLTGLIQARDAEDRLSEDELVSMVFLLLSAGHETTINLIANGMFVLLCHPEQFAALRTRPELLPTAVEEFLRFDGPINTPTIRFTTETVRIGDIDIPAEELVLVSVASANRDPDRFDEPDRLDITRPATGHIAFGHGIHFCLGAPLARQEAMVAFGHWLDRYARIELAAPAETLRYRHSLMMRGLHTLPLRVGGRH